MSDFLSNFDAQNYKETLEEKKSSQKRQRPIKKEQEEEVTPVTGPPVRRKKRKRKPSTSSTSDNQPVFVPIDTPSYTDESAYFLDDEEQEDDLEYDSSSDHEVAIDPTYASKQKRKKLVIIGGSILAMIAIYAIYFNISRVKMPEFTDKSVTEVRKWAAENRMKVTYDGTFSIEKASNDVVEQSIKPGKNVKKGSDVTVVVSDGPDPEELIPLPNFKEMTESDVAAFIDKNKAENLTVITEYDNKVDKGSFIKIDFSNKDITAENYRRRDSANVYFSKGKEVFEKNIAMPDFTKKDKATVDEWAKKNGVSVKYEKTDSDTIEEGLIISQNVKKDTKIAKNDTVIFEESLGKAVVVPNFSDMRPDAASDAVEGLVVNMIQVFSNDVPYGRLISQSIETGTKMTGKEVKPVKVVYSMGSPYIKSYYGQLEGDIPKLLYDDFNSKGASITYDVYYVDSSQEKGQIVKMSVFNQYIGLNDTVVFGISNGRFADVPSASPTEPSNDDPEL